MLTTLWNVGQELVATPKIKRIGKGSRSGKLFAFLACDQNASLLSALTVVCRSIRCPPGSLTPKDELPRSEIMELISCCFSLAPSGVASSRSARRIDRSKNTIILTKSFSIPFSLSFSLPVFISFYFLSLSLSFILFSFFLSFSHSFSLALSFYLSFSLSLCLFL